MDNNKHVVFTSVNFNYLGRALTLAKSVKQHDPSVYFVLLLVEPELKFSLEVNRKLLDCDDGSVFDEILTINDLDLSQIKDLQEYTVVEMCTAVKGQAVVKLLARKSSLFVTYLDPDLYFYRSLEQIRQKHLNSDILITPHLNHIPFLDGIIRNDEIAGVMRHGIFNLGFISFNNTKNGRDVASWWADRLNISSRVDYKNGLFTDQKWWDLSQIYFQNILVVKNDGWNMAPWNVSERRLVALNPPKLDSGDNLFFFHFSKYPSKDFDDKINSQSNSNLLNELIGQYSVVFSESQAYIDKLLLDINAVVKLNKLYIKSTPLKKLKLKSYLLYVDMKIKNSITLRKVVISNHGLKNFLAKVKRLLHRLINRIELYSTQQLDISDVQKMKLDLLIITHEGGGGVAQIVNNRLQECVQAGRLVGELKLNKGGETALFLNNSKTGITLKGELSKVIAQARMVEVHHILGLEYLLDELSEQKFDYIYLHDKYFITQIPFSDTLKYISVSDQTPGVNSPLNRKSTMNDDVWLQKTSRFLSNSSLLRAPSNYLVDQYKLAIPELKIEKFDYEPNFQSLKVKHLSANKENIILISPTGVHKGSSVLASVAKIFKSQKPSTRFNVFGDLPISTKTELENLQNIILYGQVSCARLNNALATSVPSLGWIPSLTGESYSLALSDFLSNGITVIAANTGALHERLVEVPGNYLYDPAIPTELLARLIRAIIENKGLDEFAPYFQFT
jgi:hypothetical protein